MVVEPDTAIAIFAETSEPVSAGHMQTYQAGGTRLFVMGHIYYKDVFGESHETEFCFSVGSGQTGLSDTASADTIDSLSRLAKPGRRLRQAAECRPSRGWHRCCCSRAGAASSFALVSEVGLTLPILSSISIAGRWSPCSAATAAR